MTKTKEGITKSTKLMKHSTISKGINGEDLTNERKYIQNKEKKQRINVKLQSFQ